MLGVWHGSWGISDGFISNSCTAVPSLTVSCESSCSALLLLTFARGIGLLAARAAVPASIRLILQSTRPHNCNVLSRCSQQGQDCRNTGCCEDEGFQCYEKDQHLGRMSRACISCLKLSHSWAGIVSGIGLPAGRAVSLVSIPTTRPSIRRPGPAMLLGSLSQQEHPCCWAQVWCFFFHVILVGAV